MNRGKKNRKPRKHIYSPPPVSVPSFLLCLALCLFLSPFQDECSLIYPGCPQICDLPASASVVAGITSMPLNGFSLIFKTHSMNRLSWCFPVLASSRAHQLISGKNSREAHSSESFTHLSNAPGANWSHNVLPKPCHGGLQHLPQQR